MFTTKPMLGWEMLHAVQQTSLLRCRWVAGDEACGRDTDVLDRMAALGLWSLTEVPHDTRVWLQRPVMRWPSRPRAVPPRASASWKASPSPSRSQR
jgi:hypothetical protein